MNVPAKGAVQTALAIPPTHDASADAVSKPGPPIAPAVAMFNAPTDSAEAATGVGNGDPTSNRCPVLRRPPSQWR